MGVWLTKQIFGGIAQGEQVDRPNTFSFGRNINFRRKHDAITLNQKLTKDSASAITEFPNWIRDIGGRVHAYGSSGTIFERLATGSWVSRAVIPASHGNGFGVDGSFLYYTSASFLGRIGVNGVWGADNSNGFQPITNASWNPVRYFANVNLLLVGNKQNVAVFDYASAAFSATRLIMPQGFEVRDFEEWGDYVAISMWTGQNIRKSPTGKFVLWDGLSERFNSVIDSQAGNVQMCQTDKNFLNVFAGVIGNIYRLNSGQLFQQRKIPFINEDQGEYAEIYPGAKAIYKGIPHFGVGGDTSGTSLSRGVYSWGSDEGGIPSSLNQEYTISTNAVGSTVGIGSLHVASNADFFVGWQDGSTFGIDRLDTTAQYTTGFFETLQFHGSLGEEGYNKVMKNLRLTNLPLASAHSIVVKIRNDYSASFATVLSSNTSLTSNVAGAVSSQATQLTSVGTTMPIGRMHQLRVELNGANSTAPSLVSLKLDYEVLPTS